MNGAIIELEAVDIMHSATNWVRHNAFPMSRNYN